MCVYVFCSHDNSMAHLISLVYVCVCMNVVSISLYSSLPLTISEWRKYIYSRYNVYFQTILRLSLKNSFYLAGRKSVRSSELEIPFVVYSRLLSLTICMFVCLYLFPPPPPLLYLSPAWNDCL